VQTAAAATVIFTNFAALQSIFYTKEFTFATYFNKKDNSFLLKLSFGAFAGQKSAFCVVLGTILALKCDVFLKSG
jgi:hypothetical protein